MLLNFRRGIPVGLFLCLCVRAHAEVLQLATGAQQSVALVTGGDVFEWGEWGGPLPVSITDARPSLELLTAAYFSARTGEVVRLPLERDHPLDAGWLPKAAKAAA